MKKIVIALLLILTMILPLCLASCGETTDEEGLDDISEATSEDAKTITMWVVSEELVTADVAEQVSEALNVLTKSKYKVQVNLKYFTRDEYYTKLTETMEAYSTALAEKTAAQSSKTDTKTKEEDTSTEETTTEATAYNEYGIEVVSYPAEEENQVDLVYIGDVDGMTGYQMYSKLVENGYLLALDEELDSSSKKIKEYVSPVLTSAVKESGITYAVPNNTVIGEYTYMLIRKDMLAKYSMNAYVTEGTIDRFNCQDLYTFIDTMRIFNEDEVLIGEDYDYCMDLLAYYWNIDTTTYSLTEGTGSIISSIWGSYYTDASTLSRGSTNLAVESLFANEDFVRDFKKLNEYRLEDTSSKNYVTYATSDAEKEEAVIRFVTGTKETAEQYEDDYYSVIVKYPTASETDIYSDMFGVFALSSNADAAMEVLTLINTNEEARNILQYGVEGTHYTVLDDGSVRRKTDADGYYYYNMDLYSTGNVFLAKVLEGMDADAWEVGKAQNREALVEPLLGFDLGTYASKSAETTTSVTVDSKTGYSFSYYTGYSKEILSENATLKAWLDECDADTTAGGNVYIYRTAQTVGSNIQSKYYVYNKLGGTYEGLSAEYTPITDSESGSVTGLSLVLSYKETTKTANIAGTISVLTLVCRKNNFSFPKSLEKITNEETGEEYAQYSAYISFNAINTSGETTIQNQTPAFVVNEETYIDFDFYNTENYNITVYDDITLAQVTNNTILYEWLLGVQSAVNALKTDEAKKAVYTFTYLNQKAGEIVYVYYKPRVTTKYNLYLQPMGNETSLKLYMNVEDTAVALGETSYLLYYASVKVDTSVMTINNSTLPNMSDDGSTARGGSLTNPNFQIIGNLDTELCKFMEEQNTNVNTILEKYTDYEDFAEAVDDFVTLYTPRDVGSKALPTYTDGAYKSSAVISLCETLFEDTELEEEDETLHTVFNYKLRLATSSDSSTVSQPNLDGSLVSIKTLGGEDYYGFDSLYTVYIKWSTEYGYFVETAK